MGGMAAKGLEHIHNAMIGKWKVDLDKELGIPRLGAIRLGKTGLAGD